MKHLRSDPFYPTQLTISAQPDDQTKKPQNLC